MAQSFGHNPIRVRLSRRDLLQKLRRLRQAPCFSESKGAEIKEFPNNRTAAWTPPFGYSIGIASGKRD